MLQQVQVQVHYEDMLALYTEGHDMQAKGIQK